MKPPVLQNLLLRSPGGKLPSDPENPRPSWPCSYICRPCLSMQPKTEAVSEHNPNGRFLNNYLPLSDAMPISLRSDFVEAAVRALQSREELQQPLSP